MVKSIRCLSSGFTVLVSAKEAHFSDDWTAMYEFFTNIGQTYTRKQLQLWQLTYFLSAEYVISFSLNECKTWCVNRWSIGRDMESSQWHPPPLVWVASSD